MEGMTFVGQMEQWTEDHRELTKAMVRGFGLNVDFDEVALMFRSEHEAYKFAERVIRDHGDVKLFNVATDNVQTYPIRSDYEVKYLFLETGLGYRMELMVITSGMSPLHMAMLHRMNQQQLPWVVVHHSFKLPFVDDYFDIIGRFGDDVNLALVQRCESSYGSFSYWAPHSAAQDNFIKPRVNRRDVKLMKGATDA